MEGFRFAAGEFASTVSVWDLRTRTRVSEFETTLDYGGNRLAINPRGDICAIASYEFGGLACYASETGKVINVREGLEELQYVSFSPDGRRLYCCSDCGPCVVLDADTRAVLSKYSSFNRIFCSRFCDLELRCKPRGKRMEICKVLEGTVTSFEGTTFALLHAEFGPDRVCISESAGPVRCMDSQHGREIWRYEPPKGSHALALAYCQENGHFHGVEWPYFSGGPKTLLQFNYETGKPLPIAKLGEPSAVVVFCSQGSALLTSDGDLISVVNGVSERAFAFPDLE